jgi:hypothetical protein
MTRPPFTREDVRRGVNILIANQYFGECVIDRDDLAEIVRLVLSATGHTQTRGLRAIYRAARLWLAFQTRPRCTGEANCRAHPNLDGPHMGWTWVIWRDYVPPQRRQR